MLLGAAIVVPTVVVLAPVWWVNILLCVSIAIVVLAVRIAVWKWRHPVVTADRYMEDMRRNARNN